MSKATKKKRTTTSDGKVPAKKGLSWFGAKRPVLGFVVLFAAFMGAFYGVTMIPYMEQNILPRYMEFNASASVMILNVFGEGATASGTAVRSARYSVDIRHGCDAIEPSMLFLSAVLAFPARFMTKLPGLLVGTIVLAIINLIRIVTLFYTGIHYPKWFDRMHEDVWQTAFILFSLTFWIVWALWATRPPAAVSDATPQTD
ncbi:MAG: exosortase H [Planctomycetes bacterium]|nr:exosortase H [Planctomycetota bacterium]